jgi:hypothetical protein
MRSSPPPVAQVIDIAIKPPAAANDPPFCPQPVAPTAAIADRGAVRLGDACIAAVFPPRKGAK